MHIHWIFWAYDHKEGDNYHDITTVDVLATTLEEALERAKRLVPLTSKGGTKKGAGYRLVSVVEHMEGFCK